MRAIAILLLLIVLTLPGCKSPQPLPGAGRENERILLHRTDMDWGGGTKEWWLPLDRLQRLPKWNPDKGNPLISQTKALRIARAWLKSKGVSGTYTVDSIMLRNDCAGHDEYRFDFHYRIVFGNVNAYLNHMTCIVLMDGTVLEPELAK